MVDQVREIDDDRVLTSKTIIGEEGFIQGHFPGAPIVPGAMMQEMTTQAAGVLIAANYNPMAEFDTEDPFFNTYALGVLVKIKSARYRGFARPGQTLVIEATLIDHVDPVFDFVGKITVDDKQIMRNEFQLSNILSKKLQGTA